MKMSKQADSSSSWQKNDNCFFQKILRQKCEMVFVLTQENASY